MTEKIKHDKKISIVVPVYNGEVYLVSFIESVLAQTWDNWELILVDDGSLDNSVSIAEKYARADHRITCIKEPHKSAGNARNVGLQRADGEYVCFLDADDFCKRDMLVEMISAAQEKNADIVLCQTEAFSEKKKKYFPMAWSLVERYIPDTEDGCYSKENNNSFLFQSTIISPWNKLFRTSLLKENGIQAQDQPAANDVVLSCAALACAERIYPLRKILYTQRRDNSVSITGNLATEKKYLCGYSASLGLLGELKRLGIYEKVKETYQRLAVHNCMWYLEKLYANPDLFARNYTFLQEEGFKNLELEEILPAVEYYNPNKDIRLFLQMRDRTVEEFLINQLASSKAEAAGKKKQLEDIKSSRSFRVGRVILAVPRTIRDGLRRVSPQKVSRRLKAEQRFKNAKKRIVIVALEEFHFDATANIIRICNPEKNYIAVYTGEQGKKEVGKLLGNIPAEIEWHDYKTPGVRGVIKQEKTNENIRNGFIRQIRTRKGLDYIILPSPEYHPDWYVPFVEKNGDKPCIIAGMHNINTVCDAENTNQDLAKLYAGANCYAVIDPGLVTAIQEKGVTKKVYVFSPVFDPAIGLEKEEDSGKISFIITGIIEEKRKDYQAVVDALKLLHDIFPKIRLTLLGRASSPYAKAICDQLSVFKELGLEVKTYASFVPNDVFIREMSNSDCLIAPVVVETSNRGYMEYYGKTKASGTVGDMIRHARPAIINQEYHLPEELKSSVLTYDTVEELAERMRQVCITETISALKEQAQLNSEKFLLEKMMWNASTEGIPR